MHKELEVIILFILKSHSYFIPYSCYTGNTQIETMFLVTQKNISLKKLHTKQMICPLRTCPFLVNGNRFLNYEFNFQAHNA